MRIRPCRKPKRSCRMKFTIGTRVAIGFAGVIAVSVAASVLGYAEQSRAAREATSIGNDCLVPLADQGSIVTTCWQLSLLPPQYVNADGSAQRAIDSILVE